MKLKKHWDISQIVAMTLLVSTLLTLFFYYLNRQNSWVLPEVVCNKTYTLLNGSAFQSEDLTRWLNIPEFEWEMRVSRPWSSFVELVDTKFRVFLWQYILPHPSLSLTQVFSVLVAPVLLFYMFGYLGIGKAFSYLGVALYLASPGFLSTTIMHFRPGKPMTNFSIILCLFLALRISKKKVKNRETSVLILLAVMFFSFFWDESAVLIYPIIGLLFPKLFFSNTRTKWVFFVLPLGVLCNYFIIIPGTMSLFGYDSTGFSHYGPVAQFLDFSFINKFFNNLLQNTKILIGDSFGLIHPKYITSVRLPWLLILNWMVFLYGLIWVTYSVFKKRIHLERFEIKMVVLLILCALYHNLSLTLVPNQVWGLFWYGAYFSVIFTIAVVWFIQKFSKNSLKTVMLFIPMVSSLMYGFNYTNNLYRYGHYYPYRPENIHPAFRNEVDRYKLPKFPGVDLSEETVKIWSNRSNLKKQYKENELPRTISKELFYLFVEGRIYTDRAGCWPYFQKWAQ